MAENNLYLDQQYLQRLSVKLDKFVKKSTRVWNSRCPLCGDSSHSTRKARGYFYPLKGSLFFKCHNCGVSMFFSALLKTLDSNLYQEYQFNRYKEKKPKRKDILLSEQKITTKPVVFKKSIEDVSERLDTLDPLHFARFYIESRQIPRLDLLYYTSDFQKSVKALSPTEEINNLPKDRRIIIPFYNEANKLIALQGRALESTQRYITIKLDKDTQKIYGLDRLDKTKPIYIVEGPLDSLFIDNCIAAAGSDLPQNIDGTFIMDCEPRSTEVVKKIRGYIKSGKKVCLLPEKLGCKDLNEIVIKYRYSKQDLLSLIEKHSFQGMKAQLEFKKWKKI